MVFLQFNSIQFTAFCEVLNSIQFNSFDVKYCELIQFNSIHEFELPTSDPTRGIANHNQDFLVHIGVLQEETCVVVF